MVVFAFNANTNNIKFTGFSLQWFGKLAQDTAQLKAFGNTILIALTSTVVSTIIGTLAAVGMWRYKFKGKGLIDTLLYIPVVIPEIVLGISLLLAVFPDAGAHGTLVTHTGARDIFNPLCGIHRKGAPVRL